MVVDDLHVMRVTVAPDEADSESVIDADAVLAPPIADQGFEPVPGKDRQIPKFVRRVQLAELPLGNASDTLKAAGRPPVEEALRFLPSERPDHEMKQYNVTRYMSSVIGAAGEQMTREGVSPPRSTVESSRWGWRWSWSSARNRPVVSGMRTAIGDVGDDRCLAGRPGRLSNVGHPERGMKPAPSRHKKARQLDHPWSMG